VLEAQKRIASDIIAERDKLQNELKSLKEVQIPLLEQKEADMIAAGRRQEKQVREINAQAQRLEERSEALQKENDRLKQAIREEYAEHQKTKHLSATEIKRLSIVGKELEDKLMAAEAVQRRLEEANKELQAQLHGSRPVLVSLHSQASDLQRSVDVQPRPAALPAATSTAKPLLLSPLLTSHSSSPLVTNRSSSIDVSILSQKPPSPRDPHTATKASTTSAAAAMRDPRVVLRSVVSAPADHELPAPAVASPHLPTLLFAPELLDLLAVWDSALPCHALAFVSFKGR
jgi:myosin heavy subunit